MKPYRHITAGTNHIFNWHTQASQSMILDPGHSVSSMPYNSWYKSHFQLAYPGITINDTGSRTQCIQYASSLYGKLGDEMKDRFNQDLSESLQAAFEKATNFEPCILTKQTINTRRMNEVNQIDVTNYDEDFEVNEAHIQNPNYKGKNYDPNYQN